MRSNVSLEEGDPEMREKRQENGNELPLPILFPPFPYLPPTFPPCQYVMNSKTGGLDRYVEQRGGVILAASV